jgi:pyrroloquinoline quinone (PQQ) biosynthesis protein C
VVHKFREICGDRTVAEAVAALYAYEAQVPEIATTKIDGLKKFYGVTQPEGLAYFEVHEEADKAHRAAWRGWLEEHADGSEEDILATTHEALDALWGALDAVHCERQEVRRGHREEFRKRPSIGSGAFCFVRGKKRRAGRGPPLRMKW